MADFVTEWMSAFSAAQIGREQRMLLADLLVCARRDGSVTYKPTADQRPALETAASAGWLAPLEWRGGCLRTALRIPEGA